MKHPPPLPAPRPGVIFIVYFSAFWAHQCVSGVIGYSDCKIDYSISIVVLVAVYCYCLKHRRFQEERSKNATLPYCTVLYWLSVDPVLPIIDTSGVKYIMYSSP